MEPWIVDANRDPDLALRVRQTAREVAAAGGNLWEMIGRPEPFDAGAAVIRVWDRVAFHGRDGDDLMLGAAGLAMWGHGGDDLIFQSGWTQAVHGGDGDDFIAGWSDGNVLTGGRGDDTLVGGQGNDTLAGGSGSNLLIGGFGDDYLDASSASAWRGGEFGTAGAEWIAAKRLAADTLSAEADTTR